MYGEEAHIQGMAELYLTMEEEWLIPGIILPGKRPAIIHLRLLEKEVKRNTRPGVVLIGTDIDSN